MLAPLGPAIAGAGRAGGRHCPRQRLLRQRDGHQRAAVHRHRRPGRGDQRARRELPLRHQRPHRLVVVHPHRGPDRPGQRPSYWYPTVTVFRSVAPGISGLELLSCSSAVGTTTVVTVEQGLTYYVRGSVSAPFVIGNELFTVTLERIFARPTTTWPTRRSSGSSPSPTRRISRRPAAKPTNPCRPASSTRCRQGHRLVRLHASGGRAVPRHRGREHADGTGRVHRDGLTRSRRSPARR